MCIRDRLKRDQDGAPLLFAGMITRLENKGRIDHITGLLTQKSCIDHLAILLESGKHGSMMLLGLDDFSHINTLQNHVFGDIVLRQFAQDIQSLLPYDAQIYRYDGDQFAIVYDEADEKKDVYKRQSICLLSCSTCSLNATAIKEYINIIDMTIVNMKMAYSFILRCKLRKVSLTYSMYITA